MWSLPNVRRAVSWCSLRDITFLAKADSTPILHAATQGCESTPTSTTTHVRSCSWIHSGPEGDTRSLQGRARHWHRKHADGATVLEIEEGRHLETCHPSRVAPGSWSVAARRAVQRAEQALFCRYRVGTTRATTDGRSALNCPRKWPQGQVCYRPELPIIVQNCLLPVDDGTLHQGFRG